MDGNGSRWNSSQLFVGDGGFGILKITHGGSVSNTFTGAIRWNTNGTGTVICRRRSSTWTAGSLTVGSTGAQRCILRAAAAATASYASINSKSLLAIDVGNGSLLDLNSGAGNLANNGTVRILAGAARRPQPTRPSRPQ